MKFFEMVGQTTAQSIYFGGAAFCAGYLLAAYRGTNKRVTAVAFAAAVAATRIFNQLNTYITGGPKSNPGEYYINAAICGPLLSTFTLVIFRKLEIVGESGTIVWGSLIGFASLMCLSAALVKKAEF